MSSYTFRRAFTLVEIIIVVLIIGLLIAIAVPNYFRAGTTSRRNTCIESLRQIDSAKEQWAMDMKQPTGALPTAADLLASPDRLTGYILDWPVCPSAGTYSINPVGTNPTCSIAGHILP